jgi:hypothetical protein
MRKTKTAQFKLLLQPDLHAMIRREARKAGRSLNAEIEKRLQESFVVATTFKHEALAELLTDLTTRVRVVDGLYGEGAYAKGVKEEKQVLDVLYGHGVGYAKKIVEAK